MRRKTIVTDLIGYIPIKFLPAISGVFLVVAATKALSPENYATYTIALTISLVLVQLGVGWIGSSIVFFLLSEKRREYFLVSVFVIGIGVIFFIGILIAVLSYFLLENFNLSLAVSVMSVGQATFLIFSAVCQAERKVSLQLGMAIAANLVVFSLIVFLFYGQVNDVVVIFVMLSMAHLAAGLIYIYAGNIASCLRHCPPKRSMIGAWCKRIIAYGGPMSLWSAATLLIISCDKFFVRSIEYSGVYLSAKDLLIGLSSLLSMPLIMTMHPVIFSAFRNKEDYWGLVIRAAEILSLVFGVVWYFLEIIGFEWLGNILNKNYLSVKFPLLAVFFGLYLGACLIYFQKDLEMKGRTTALAGLVSAVCFISIFVSYFLVPTGGLMYGALIFVAGQLVCLLLVLYFSQNLVVIFRPLFVFFIVVVLGESCSVVEKYILGEYASISGLTPGALLYSIVVLFFALKRIARLGEVEARFN
jgi:O-antigen/teichoic acid export membrane protein